MADDLENVLQSPNCATCLQPLDIAGTEEHRYWWCPRCRVAALSSQRSPGGDGFPEDTQPWRPR
ncbi:hypothetical protein [Salinibacterium sp. ZJ450]|uniref:hypothetical protein n=1 Tax=Salinibacterium sp. ZJ450 TaxID=2708338 RepID=UPI00142042EF|nr:hypothetical protein [Salinibacterium sp. ZJ450]